MQTEDIINNMDITINKLNEIVGGTIVRLHNGSPTLTNELNPAEFKKYTPYHFFNNTRYHWKLRNKAYIGRGCEIHVAVWTSNNKLVWQYEHPYFLHHKDTLTFDSDNNTYLPMIPAPCIIP